MKRLLPILLLLAAGASRAAAEEAAPELPVLEFPAAGDSDTMAVLYSGDGGWWSLENGVSKDLAAHGVPVLGWNSLKYFWKARTPESAAADLAAAIERASAQWQRPNILLAGYSFGADVLPFIVQKLPPELRSRVKLVALIAPWHNADFEFHFSGWVGDPKRADSRPVLEGIAGLKGLKVLCLYGRDDADASCEETDHGSVTVVPMQGGHGFTDDSTLLSAEILKALK